MRRPQENKGFTLFTVQRTMFVVEMTNSVLSPVERGSIEVGSKIQSPPPNDVKIDICRLSGKRFQHTQVST